MNEHISTSKTRKCPIAECPDCESIESSIEICNQIFDYGQGPDSVELSCDVPVNTCQHCGCQWTTHTAEIARHEAVCRHLKRLTPAEVKDIRERNCLTQLQFSELTGLGEASLSRWETGVQIQNAACDRFLRLIDMDEKNFHRLEAISESERAVPPFQFRTITITPQLRSRQSRFQLRLVS